MRATLAAAVLGFMAATWATPSAAADGSAPPADAPIGSGLDDVSAPKLPWPEPTPEMAPLTLMDNVRLLRRPDGSVVLGATRWDKDQYAYWLAYLDADGQVQRQVVVPLKENEFPADAIATVDGGFLLFSSIRALWLIRLDPDGRRLWTRALDGYEVSLGFAPRAAELPDGGFIIAGSSSGRARTLVRYRVSRVNADGQPLWQKNYGRSGERFVSGLAIMSDGLILVDANHDFFAIGMHGQMQWRRSPELLVGVVPSSSGTALAIERDMGRDDWPRILRFSLVRLDRTGRVAWRRPQNFAAPHLTELHIQGLAPIAESDALVFINRHFDLPAIKGTDGTTRPPRDAHVVSILRYDGLGIRLWGRTVVGPSETDRTPYGDEIADAALLPNGRLLLVGHGFAGDQFDLARWWIRTLAFD